MSEGILALLFKTKLSYWYNNSITSLHISFNSIKLEPGYWEFNPNLLCDVGTIISQTVDENKNSNQNGKSTVLFINCQIENKKRKP